MFHSRHNSSGSFRGGLEMLARVERPLRRRQPPHPEPEPAPEWTDPRRDPAFHNRALFAGADR